jgi:antitoxin (DNA-binding transcriptional repressor) of toxin-antitoxin stability system
MQTISTTDLTRNTREILDKVVSRGETIAVERNHTQVAKIVPPDRIMTAQQALAGFEFPVLTPEEAAAWLKDSRGNFDETVRDPWA